MRAQVGTAEAGGWWTLPARALAGHRGARHRGRGQPSRAYAAVTLSSAATTSSRSPSDIPACNGSVSSRS